MSLKLKRSLLAVLLAGAAVGAQAHKPWMLPSSTMIEGKDAWVSVDAAISEDLFDINHMPLKLDGLVITAPDGNVVKPENVMQGHMRSSFDVALSQPGTYKASIVSQNVMASYMLNGEMKRWRGSEEAFAKEVPGGAQDLKVTRMQSRLETFFSANTLSEGVFKPSGSGLEFVPVTNPTDLRTGEKATWRFLIDGKPAAGQAFSLIPGDVRFRGTLGEIRMVTDARGELTFTLPAGGRYMVSSSWPASQAPADGKPPAMPPRRLSYAATVEVMPQ
jgi:uncharacterized GH25 family protein